MTESPYDKNPYSGIAISSLIRAFRCPRQYYFYKKNEFASNGKYIICREVSSSGQDETFDQIWKTVNLLDPTIPSKLQDFLHVCLDANKNAPRRPWTELDRTVRSKQLSIYGQLDKFDERTGECTLTRCTKAPKTGCWPDDRVRATALLLCVSETADIRPKGIYIEYIPSGIIRYYTPTPKDRRIVIHTLRQIHAIDKGNFPPRPLNPPCKGCRFEDTCTSYEPRKLSGLFKKW